MNQRIRLKLGENEIEVEGEEQFIEKHLKNFFNKLTLTPTLDKGSVESLPSKTLQVPSKPEKVLSPAEFFKQKKPKGGTEQLIVLAKYLEDYKSLSEFSNKDINQIAKLAQLRKLDNKYYNLAVKQGLINKHKRAKYSLSLSGEDTVIGMPSSVK